MHELEDAVYYAAIGVGFLKDDSCSPCTSAAGNEADVETDYERMQMALDAVGGNISLFVEGQPDITKVYTGAFGNGRRVGHDISANWQSMISLVDIAAGLWPYAHTDTGTGSFFNWLDFLQVGNGDFVPAADANTESKSSVSAGDAASRLLLPMDEGSVRARAHVSIYAALKSLLFLGNRLDSTLTNATIGLLTNSEVVAVNQDLLAVQARRVQTTLPSNISIVLDNRASTPLLAPCNLSDALQQWRYTPHSNTSTLVIATCNASDAAQVWSGLQATASGSYLRNKATSGCLDTAVSIGYAAGTAPCKPGTSSQDFILEAGSSHIRLNASNTCLDVYDFRGPNVFMGSCKQAGSSDENQKFAFDASTGLVHTSGSGQHGMPANQCLAMATPAGGRLWLPKAAGPFVAPNDDAPAVCLSLDGPTEGAVHIVPCDPSQPLPGGGQSIVPTLHSDNSTRLRLGPAGNYSFAAASLGWGLSWNAQFGASGPLPHTRWATGTRSSGGLFWFDPSATTGSLLRARDAAGMIDDDGVGHVTRGGDYCLTAARAGNLEVWAGPLTHGRYVVVLLNRSPANDTMTALWANLPSAEPPTASDRTRAEGRAIYTGPPTPRPHGPTSAFVVRDLWEHADLGTFTGSFTSPVPALGARMLLLTPA